MNVGELKEWGNDLQKHFGINTKWIPKEEFDEIGHQSTEQFGAVFTEAGFAMNPMAFLNGFANATVDAGAQLHSHSRVLLICINELFIISYKFIPISFFVFP